MAGMGPPPKAAGARARRNATLPMTTLPASREGAAPEWPLRPDLELAVAARAAERAYQKAVEQLSECTDGRRRKRLERVVSEAETAMELAAARLEETAAAELALWARLWTTPQATAWESLGQYNEIALYVRWQVQAEMGSLAAAKEARQWSDRLGLNPLSMLRLRQEVDRADAADERGKRRRTVVSPASGGQQDAEVETGPRPAGPRRSGGGGDPRAVLRSVG